MRDELCNLRGMRVAVVCLLLCLTQFLSLCSGTEVLINEDEYVFVRFQGPTRLDYEVSVAAGPNVDVLLMTESNFVEYSRNAWFISWKFIDAGSKQNTRYAKISIDLAGDMPYYLVIDNRDGRSWATGSEPVSCSISFRSSSDDGLQNQPIQGLRTMPALRFTLLLFLAALPGWPLFRHYYTLFRSSYRRRRGRQRNPDGPPAFTIFLFPLLISATVATLVPLSSVQRGLQKMLDDFLLAIRYPSGFLACFIEAFFITSLSEELTKFIVLLSSLPLVTNHASGAAPLRGTYLLCGAVVSLGFCLVENFYYGIGYDAKSFLGFETLFIRALTSIPSHVVGGIIMGGLLGEALGPDGQTASWFGLIKALLLPLLLHGVYDYPLMLSESGLFDKDILSCYMLVLLYLEDGYAHHLFLDDLDEQHEE